MLKSGYFILIAAFSLLISCSPRATGTKSKTGAPTEDLSKYRPPVAVDAVEEPVLTEQVMEPKPTSVTPVNDITYKLDNILDSLEVRSGERTVQGYTIQVYPVQIVKQQMKPDH